MFKYLKNMTRTRLNQEEKETTINQYSKDIDLQVVLVLKKFKLNIEVHARSLAVRRKSIFPAKRRQREY